LAVDLWEATTNKIFMSNTELVKYYNWLDTNAHKYGFHNTYQKGLEID
jgi:LAS superfamily LD-carboxypeptidase LdcB